MTNPKEPTLACSEVVERLAADIRKRYQAECKVFMDALEEIIEPRLHSWRERRVQELEAENAKLRSLR